jgi:hypothetical protein
MDDFCQIVPQGDQIISQSLWNNDRIVSSNWRGLPHDIFQIVSRAKQLCDDPLTGCCDRYHLAPNKKS